MPGPDGVGNRAKKQLTMAQIDQAESERNSSLPEFHPYANIFPLIDGEPFEQLVESVKEHGLREPIVLHEGKILDGRNRARACAAANIEPQYIKFYSIEPFQGDDPLAFVVDKNLRRRHLDESQRAMVAARLATMKKGARTDLAPIGARSDATAAKLFNIGERSVERAKKVQRNGVQTLVAAVDQGQIAVSTAERIAKLPAPEQESELARALPKGARTIMASRHEHADSLDFSPTPPWATRALVERVFPAMKISHASLTSVAEPAAGEGHMAEVLREYFATVVCSDVHDYGCGDAVQDFLASEVAVDVDWIITNPPFGDKAERFALKAIDQARVGVAIFARLQWLETVGRYEHLFRDHPPTQLAFFVERVSLCMGRWEPKGGTATAYIWLVWVKGRSPRPPLWIPPNCKKTLTRPDDAGRFTAHPVIKKEHAANSAAAGLTEDQHYPIGDDFLEIPAFLRRRDSAFALSNGDAA
jgi:ParB-like chromosome segregation protein Spo0J